MNYQNYRLIYVRAYNAGHPDKTKTLKAFQRRAILTRSAIQALDEEYRRDLNELGETYSAKEFDRRREALDHEYNEIVRIAKAKCLEDLEDVLNGKREQFDKSCGAPTEEQLRLLQVLSMRNNVTETEIRMTAAKMNDNIPALRLLAEIAKKHDVLFPNIGDADELDAAISSAEGFAKEMIDSIGVVDDQKLTYQQFSFWRHPDTATVADSFFAPLDESIFVAQQQKQEKPTKANAVKVYLRGDEYLAGIADQFGIDSEEIRKANPDRSDFSSFNNGDTLIIPAGTLKITNAPRSIVEGQCIPVYVEG